MLVIQEDAARRRDLSRGLAAEGIEVREAGTAADARRRLSERRADVVLIEITRSDRAGLAMCRELRDSWQTPVIVLSARRGSRDVVAAIDAGADHHVSTPWTAEEVSARVRALCRRHQGGASPRRIPAGDLEILPDGGVVLCAGRAVDLTRTEFCILRELALAQGSVVSQEDLLDRVWGPGYRGDRALLHTHVRRLRTKVEPDPAQPQLVTTVRGRGYSCGFIGSS
ncbi:response regulator transcription factor [Modestobacter sp. VKM Ac-2984]|uniref:response regulator transcription factor n=1 Tax=Modestobacter sp. VKM Ac-2984 TaxID=3004138 RepID=UPI0022AB1338|nr:response regulator transcription factor [Modestobacter sp. VKM Ac-2984]MCZ2815054.1 response regulator transcription factor [Modestobacter sp. VKM Ac-2984]